MTDPASRRAKAQIDRDTRRIARLIYLRNLVLFLFYVAGVVFVVAVILAVWLAR